MKEYFERQNELAKHRKSESLRLMKSLDSKLAKIQKMVIKKIRLGEKDISFQMCSFSEGVRLDFNNGKYGDPDTEIRFAHWDFMDFGFDNSICEFYSEQIRISNVWINLLSK
jgi:hypothetical protein